jgi:16S rRNA (uracil1498-N3)-methyltransferase
MADRFYVNCPLAPGLATVLGPEAHHLATVCRVRAGDQVCLFNGDGREYPARVLTVARRSVTLEVSGPAAPPRELPFAVEVAAPLPKGDRAQFLLEKLTELGVTSFVPLQTRRSVVHPREAKLDKLQRYVIEASKQCGRNVLLQVRPLVGWETYCRRDGLPAWRVLAHPQGAAEPRRPGDPEEMDRADRAFAVGPEGGFTLEEVDAARDAGWQVITLGPRILRVETAALVLAASAAVAVARGSCNRERS